MRPYGMLRILQQIMLYTYTLDLITGARARSTHTISSSSAHCLAPVQTLYEGDVSREIDEGISRTFAFGPIQALAERQGAIASTCPAPGRIYRSKVLGLINDLW